MAYDFNNLQTRLTAVSNEISYRRRQNTEIAKELVTALNNLTDKEVQDLVEQFPALAVVRTYTVEQIVKNANHEIETLTKLRSDMSFEADARLQELERSLCLT